MSKVRTLDNALSAIRPGDAVASVGVIGWLVPDALLKGIADRFKSGRGAGDLTFFFPVGVGDALGIPGMDHVAVPGLMRRVISGNYINPVHPTTGCRPALMRMINDDAVEAYAWPIGATMHWLREVARRGPGYLTKIGLGTFIDPEQGGGRLNARTTEPLVRRCTFAGEKYLHYPTWALNIGLIRASAADEAGNLRFDDEPLQSAALATALAVKACGGTVIAQVGRIVPRGETPAQLMRIPGALVDSIVVQPDAMMTTDVLHDPRYLGGRFSRDGLSVLPRGTDKVIARRAAREVRRHEVSIFGFGLATGIPLVMAEDGLFDGNGIDEFPHTTEHGAFGGIVMNGWQFSANLFPESLIDGPSQFDFIDGGNCKFAALSFAQLDTAGNVNVSKFSGFSPGSGGFIDIATCAERLVLTGTLTTGGLQCELTDRGLTIAREGRIGKFVATADQVTYPLRRGVTERDQCALVVTERAVFRMDAQGLVLVEIADGVDVDRDVLGQMQCGPVRVAPDLALMDAALFAA